MAENINFIPATELPEATGEEVSVLCLENGEMKQKSGASFGGGETPDMVITVTDTSYACPFGDNYSITEGSVDAVFAAVRDGRYPIVKIRYNYDRGSYTFIREEYDAHVTVYGESLWLAYTTVSPDTSGSLYYHKCYMNSDGTMSSTHTSEATLTTVQDNYS